MPIKIPDNLPAFDILQKENIFIMPEDRAFHQDIRPLRIAIVNLMPLKIVTETQLLRLLGNSPLQVEIVLVKIKSHESKNTSKEHLETFYVDFEQIQEQKFDGLIITGAPLEKIEFEEVSYWEELTKIMDWSTTNVFSTIHICWAALAGLYYHYGIDKVMLDKKISGIYKHKIKKKHRKIFRGFDDEFEVPHSRYSGIDVEACMNNENLEILADSKEAGPYIVATKSRRRIFISGHPEYDPDTLKLEYERDLASGIECEIPENYFKNDDPSGEPICNWRSHSNLLFNNWLNYYLYQMTPFQIESIDNNIEDSSNVNEIEEENE